jgi:hypothetical protein
MRVFFVHEIARISWTLDFQVYATVADIVAREKGVCWRSCVTMGKYNAQSVEKSSCFFSGTINADAEFSSARLLGVDFRKASACEDV